MNITEVLPQDDYMLFIQAEDGSVGLFDVKPYLDFEAFTPLKDQAEFQRIRNGKYFVEWQCGADLSADTIYAHWTPVSDGLPRAAHRTQ